MQTTKTFTNEYPKHFTMKPLRFVFDHANSKLLKSIWNVFLKSRAGDLYKVGEIVETFDIFGEPEWAAAVIKPSGEKTFIGHEACGRPILYWKFRAAASAIHKQFSVIENGAMGLMWRKHINKLHVCHNYSELKSHDKISFVRDKRGWTVRYDGKIVGDIMPTKEHSEYRFVLRDKFEWVAQVKKLQDARHNAIFETLRHMGRPFDEYFALIGVSI